MDVIIYHQASAAKYPEGKPAIDCPDGICGAWVIGRYLTQQGVDFQLIGDAYMNFDDYKVLDCPPVEVPEDVQRIWLVDFSYPKHLMEYWIDQEIEIVLLEHHSGKMLDLSELSNRIAGGVDTQECGASFAWKYCFRDEPTPWFIPHIWSRDTGISGYYDALDLDSRAVTTAIANRRLGKQGVEAFPVFDELLDTDPNQIKSEGYALLAETDDPICNRALKRWIASPKFIKIDDRVAPVIEFEKDEKRLYSWILARLRNHTDSNFVVGVFDRETMSLRSKKGGCDVAAIAKKFGGNGHQAAAGVRLTPTEIENMLMY